jgi:hypothetical protein
VPRIYFDQRNDATIPAAAALHRRTPSRAGAIKAAERLVQTPPAINAP